MGEAVRDVLSDNARVLRSVAARIVGESDADDVVQETFLRALVSPPADADSPIRPWLVTVARHVAIDWLRKHGRVELAEVEEAPDEAEPPTRGDLVALVAGLGRQSEGEVVVLLLRDALDLSVEEVADALGSTPGSVRVLHLRARRKAAAAVGVDPGNLVALDRFLTWLLAREVAGLPVRAHSSPAPDPAFAPGVMEAHGRLLDAMVEAAHAAGRSDLEARARLSRGSVRRTVRPRPPSTISGAGSRSGARPRSRGGEIRASSCSSGAATRRSASPTRPWRRAPTRRSGTSSTSSCRSCTPRPAGSTPPGPTTPPRGRAAAHWRTSRPASRSSTRSATRRPASS